MSLEGRFPSGPEAALLREHGWVLASTSHDQVAIAPSGAYSLHWRAAVEQVKAEKSELDRRVEALVAARLAEQAERQAEEEAERAKQPIGAKRRR
jgi:hypothetical protein